MWDPKIDDGPINGIIETSTQVGEIVGIRCWATSVSNLYHHPIEVISTQQDLPPSDLWLRSYIVLDKVWYPHCPTRCEMIRRAPSWQWPEYKSKAGIHAYKKLEDLNAYIEDMLYGNHRELIVIGTIEMWGIVWEHKRGYRAEHAAIKSIDGFYKYDNEKLLNMIREKYL